MSLERLKEIYKNLTGEPTPDEEEAAQKELVGIFQNILSSGNIKKKELVEESLSIVQKWDPLELWFKEVPKLSENIKTIIEENLKDESAPKKEVSETNAGTGSKILSEELNQKLSKEIAEAISEATKDLPPGVNIGQIIKTVTEQVTKNFMNNYAAGGNKVEEPKQDAKKSLSKEDIMSSMLKDMAKKKTEAKIPEQNGAEKPKLLTPKIEIPKVVKPMQKITPKDSISSEVLNPEEDLNNLLEDDEDKNEPSKVIMSPTAHGPQVIPQIKRQPIQQQPSSAPTVKLPEPKKIVIPQPQKINIPEKIENVSTPEQPKKPQIVIKPVAGIQESKNITVEKQPVVLKPISQAQPVVPIQPIQPINPNDPQKIAQKPKITVKAQPGGVQPVQIQPISASVPVVKPVSIQVNDSKSNLIEAFSQKEKPKSLDKPKVGGITAVNIGGGEMEAFTSQKVEVISKKENFESFETSDIYANKSKDELYQELIALEGKKYAIERTRKDMRTKHEKGLIQDIEYKTAIERYKYDLEHIGEKINTIRKRLESM